MSKFSKIKATQILSTNQKSPLTNQVNQYEITNLYFISNFYHNFKCSITKNE